MKKEYRNLKIEKGWRTTYVAELWIDDKFAMNVYLSETDYRYNVLMYKLETLLDKETLNEVEEVMQLKYEEGSNDEAEVNAGADL